MSFVFSLFGYPRVPSFLLNSVFHSVFVPLLCLVLGLYSTCTASALSPFWVIRICDHCIFFLVRKLSLFWPHLPSLFFLCFGFVLAVSLFDYSFSPPTPLPSMIPIQLLFFPPKYHPSRFNPQNLALIRFGSFPQQPPPPPYPPSVHPQSFPSFLVRKVGFPRRSSHINFPTLSPFFFHLCFLVFPHPFPPRVMPPLGLPVPWTQKVFPPTCPSLRLP